jgi:hypothetical protein
MLLRKATHRRKEREGKHAVVLSVVWTSTSVASLPNLEK